MQQNKLAILIHSSKTMQSNKAYTGSFRQPLLLKEAAQLMTYMKTLSIEEIEKVMHVSYNLATKTKTVVGEWQSGSKGQTLALDSFIGDIYSGLRAQELSKSDRDYADTTLWILSGLYGVLKPYDGVQPYRVEMGYKFPDQKFGNLYTFWGSKIARQLPAQGIIVNVSSVEYTKAVLPFIDENRVTTPHFLTVNPKTGEPGFTVVHAKIARGAFARWLITSRITDPARFGEFNDLGYSFNASLSTLQTPTFICKDFGGLGLSIRLK